MEQQYTEEPVAFNDHDRRDDEYSLNKWKSLADAATDSDDTPTGFECNICLDSVQEPVVTLCGHLYCWPCIYKWLHFQSVSEESLVDQPQQQCPVCKAEVSESTLVPLFGKGPTVKPSKSNSKNLGIIIPRRPLACGFDSPRSPIVTSSPRSPYQRSRLSHASSPLVSPSGTTPNATDPMFGEMIYARVFSNSVTNMYSDTNSYQLAGVNSPRVRRHMMEVNKSLNRICFFLFCCVFVCFLLF